MKITLDFDHEWQANLIRDLTKFITAEHPLAGSAKAVSLAFSIKFKDGTANGVIGGGIEEQGMDDDLLQFMRIGGLALSRVQQIVTMAGGDTDSAASLFCDAIRRIANEHADETGLPASASVEDAISQARKHYHRRKPQ